MARFNDPVQPALDITDKIKDSELDYHEVLIVYAWKKTGWEELDYCAHADTEQMYRDQVANEEIFKRALFYVVFWRMEDEMLQETVFNAKD